MTKLSLLLLSMPGPGELLLILFIILLLFGARRLPEIARGVGEGIRELKKSLFENPERDKNKEEDKTGE